MNVSKKKKYGDWFVPAVMFTIMVLLFGLIAVLVLVNDDKLKDDAPAPTPANVTVPTKLTDDGSFVLKTDGSVADKSYTMPKEATRAQLIFDFSCPGCGAVDRSLSGTLAERNAANEISLHLTPVSFLDSPASDNYSTRAANAFVTVAEKDPKNAYKFMTALYSDGVQPAEGVTAPTNEKLKELATGVGVKPEVADEFSKGTYNSWLQLHTKRIDDRRDLFEKTLSTPAMFLGGHIEDGKLVNSKMMTFTEADTISDSFVKALDEAKKRESK